MVFKRRFLALGLAAAALAAGALYLHSAKAGPEAARPAPGAGSRAAAPGAAGQGARGGKAETVFSVKVARASRSTLRSYIDVAGDVQTTTSVDVYPDIGGRVASLEAELGEAVEKGQVLATVDPSLPGSRYALSPVSSPISGTLTDLPVRVGARVTSSTAIATVGLLSRLEVKTLIRERDVGEVKVGQRAVLRFEAYPGRSFEARVSKLSPVLDKTSRTRSASIAVEGGEGLVAPGMYARARIYTTAYPDALTVPGEALFERSGAEYLYLAEGQEGAERARLVEVERGAAVDGLVEIRGGLSEGDRVVTAGRASIGEGAALRIVPEGKAAK